MPCILQDRREFERGSIPVPYDQGLAPHRHHDGMQRESAPQPTLDNDKPHIFTHEHHPSPDLPAPDHHSPV